MNNVACDWLISWLYVTHDADRFVKNNAFSMFIVKKNIRMWITIFKFFIWGDKSAYIHSEITFYSNA